MQLPLMYSRYVETTSFKDFMSMIPASVSVIGVVKESQILGCTISSLVSLNVVNPELMFVLRNGSTLLNAIDHEGVFSINVLSDRQKDLADHYSSAREIESLDNTKNPWKVTGAGSIVLDNSKVSFVCRLKRREQLETSTLIFCTPEVAVGSVDTSPLTYSNRDYFSLSKLSNI
jgi:flavin reductase (DIM6/NTAB) family NADH-FMN oxidoreductase RutF